MWCVSRFPALVPKTGKSSRSNRAASTENRRRLKSRTKLNRSVSLDLNQNVNLFPEPSSGRQPHTYTVTTNDKLSVFSHSLLPSSVLFLVLDVTFSTNYPLQTIQQLDSIHTFFCNILYSTPCFLSQLWPPLA